MKQKRGYLLLILVSGLSYFSAIAQDYEEIYDDPYAINKLFIAFQPFYGELFATNVNAGFGFEVDYFHKKMFSVKGHMRKTYSSRFYDFNRELAGRNSMSENKPEIFNYYEIGGTYHIKDFDESAPTLLVIRKKGTFSRQLASTIQHTTEVTAKVRKIYGARAGAIIWNSTADITRTLEKQGLTNTDLVTADNLPLPATYVDENGETQNLTTYSNLYTTNLYAGFSYTQIRNFAVSFDNYQESMDDGIVTFFADVMFAPSMTLDPVLYGGREYHTDVIKLNNIGFRAGMDGKYNRKIAWSYGGEIGYRPSLDGRGFFALLKIAFPVFSSNLQKKVENVDE